MSKESKRYVFEASEIFQEIPDDPKHVNLTIPDEVAKEAGLEPGDAVKVLWGDQGTVIIQKVNEETHGEG